MRRLSVSRQFFYVLAAALAFRLILIPNPGFEADISFWKSWGLATVDRGAVEGIKITNNNYPTPFAYTLGALVWVYKLFADPHDFGQFWTNTNLLFLTISKTLPILGDFGIAALIVYVGRHAKRLGFPQPERKMFGLPFYEFIASAYLLSPLSLIDGAWWGQVDSLGVFLFMGALILAVRKQPLFAGAVFAVAMLTKLQNMIYGPVFFLFLWQLTGYSGLIRGLAGAVAAFGIMNAEFFLSGNADRVFLSLTDNYDYFPWMSLMAYNLWWIATGARGLVTSDKLLSVGIMNAKSVGLVLFSSFYLFASVKQYLESRRSVTVDGAPAAILLRPFLESLILINGAFFLFQTESHDRYAFPLAVFLLLWLPFAVTDSQNRISRIRLQVFSLLYGIYTVFYFYNLHTALAVNYPGNSLPVLNALTQPVFTIATAFVLIALFVVFAGETVRVSRAARSSLFLSVLAAGIMLFMGNRPVFTRQPVPLTSFAPWVSEQTYGTRQTNRTVQSSFGSPYDWNRLSVQYLFYRSGIGSHAPSRYVFDIGRHFSRFTADAGMDTEAGVRASGVFEIYGDGKLLYRSRKQGRYDLPVHADVSVRGVKMLELILTDAGDGNYDDHGDWLNPTLWF